MDFRLNYNRHSLVHVPSANEKRILGKDGVLMKRATVVVQRGLGTIRSSDSFKALRRGFRPVVGFALVLSLGALGCPGVGGLDFLDSAVDSGAVAPGSRVVGRWESADFGIVIVIEGTIATVAVSNSAVNPVGRIILSIESSDADSFTGQYRFSDGTIDTVRGEFQDDNTINMVGHGNAWTLRRTNRAPVVDAGADWTGELPRTSKLELTGSASDDGVGRPNDRLIVQWSRLSGPGEVMFDPADDAETVAMFRAAGTYVLQLTATDGVLASEDTVLVTVEGVVNLPPVVSAGDDRTLNWPTNSLDLTATASDDGRGDPDGNITIQWNVVSGPGNVTFGSAGALETSATFSEPGIYLLRFTADDGALATSDQLKVSIFSDSLASPGQGAGAGLNVNAGNDRTTTLPSTNSLTLQGTVTGQQNNADPLTVEWSMISGPGEVTFQPANTQQTTATFTAAGEYILQLQASQGASVDSDTVSITIEGTLNGAPTVTAGSVPASVLIGTSIRLNGSATDDGLPNGTLTTKWRAVSGPGAAAFDDDKIPTTRVSFSASGVYVLELSASDGGLTSTATVSVTVLPVNQAPVVTAGANQEITLPTDSVQLAGTVTDDGLPPGVNLAISWSVLSGNGAAVELVTPNAPRTMAIFSQAGVYEFQLRANDGEFVGRATTVVTVLAP